MKEANIILLLFLIIILSICCIATNNPVFSVILLIIIYLLTAIIFISLKAEFLGLALIVVYVGAISILFLFVIMMLNIRLLETRFIFHSIVIKIGLVFVIISLWLILIYSYQLQVLTYYSKIENNIWFSLLNSEYDIKIIGYVLINYNTLLLPIVGIILLISLLGSIMLTSGEYIDVTVIYDDIETNKAKKLLNKGYGIR